MVNFKLGNEMWKVNWSTWLERWTKKKIVTELKINYLYSLTTTQDDFHGADTTSMHDACHIWTQSNDFALHEFS